MSFATSIPEQIAEELALIKLRKSSKLVYGLKQNLRSDSKEFFVSTTYVDNLKDLESSKKIYVVSAKFLEKFAIEKKRMHMINVIGAKS